MVVENDVIKSMVACCDTEEEADEVIKEFTTLETYAEKRDFLITELFPDVSIVAGCDGENGDPDRTDYEAVLSAAVNLKWR